MDAIATLLFIQKVYYYKCPMSNLMNMLKKRGVVMVFSAFLIASLSFAIGYFYAQKEYRTPIIIKTN